MELNSYVVKMGIVILFLLFFSKKDITKTNIFVLVGTLLMIFVIIDYLLPTSNFSTITNSCINKCSKGSSKEGFAGVSVDELADDVISDITEDRMRKQDEKDKVNAVLEATHVKKISQVNANKETDHTTQDKSSDLISSEMPDQITKEIPDQITREISDPVSSEMPDQITREISDPVSSEMPDYISSKTPNQISREIPGYISDEMPDQISREIPEPVSSEMPDYISSEIPDQRPDQRPGQRPGQPSGQRPDQRPGQRPGQQSEHPPNIPPQIATSIPQSTSPNSATIDPNTGVRMSTMAPSATPSPSTTDPSTTTPPLMTSLPMSDNREHFSQVESDLNNVQKCLDIHGLDISDKDKYEQLQNNNCLTKLQSHLDKMKTKEGYIDKSDKILDWFLNNNLNNVDQLKKKKYDDVVSDGWSSGWNFSNPQTWFKRDNKYRCYTSTDCKICPLKSETWPVDVLEKDSYYVLPKDTFRERYEKITGQK